MNTKNWAFLLLFTFGIFINVSINLIAQKPIKTRHKSITFIIGKDKSTNKYYANAAQYFRQHQTGKNNKIIISPLSLSEILDYLNNIPQGEYWDKVNIISHGNSWTGMAIKISPKGSRTMLGPLTKAQTNGILPHLRNNIFDKDSQVIIYACGLGTNKPLMYKLKEIFSSEDINPTLTSTKLFNIFAVGKTTSKYSLAHFYNSFHVPKQHPGNNALISQLKNRYPNTTIDWADALSRKLPKYEGQAFYYIYKIPVSWTEVYKKKEDVPKLLSEEGIKNWILNQEDFLKLIKKYDIPLDLYQWTVQYKEYTNSRGEQKPTMKIKGKTVVISILQQLVNKGTQTTYIPDFSNEAFFMTL